MADSQPIEEEPVLLEKMEDFQVERLRELLPGEQARPVAADEMRRQGQAELIEEARLQDVPVQAGPTLHQNGAVAGAVQVVEDKFGLDPARAGDHDLRVTFSTLAGTGVALLRDEHDRPLFGVGKKGRAPVEVAGPRDHGYGWDRCLPAGKALAAEIFFQTGRAVVLGPHRARTHEHDVSQRPQGPEDPPVRRPAELP